MKELTETYEYQQGKQTHHFKKVANPKHWKLPTLSIVVKTSLEAMAIADAVAYFTGGTPSVSKVVPNGYRVNSSDGYYINIGA